MTGSADLTELARRARAVMSDARAITLMIGGVGRICPADPAVLLHDRDGHPTFLCQSGSPVTPAATRRCPAVLSVIGCDESGTALSVTVTGRLARLGTEDRAEELVDVVGLTPAAVWVEEDDPAMHHVLQRAVPLDLYASAAPDALGRWARRMTTHAAQAHQGQLRTFVAVKIGVPIGAVAGVTMTALGAFGAQLQWVDAAGSHCLELTFDQPAHTPAELAERLRSALRC
jgi:hypothetical protein